MNKCLLHCLLMITIFMGIGTQSRASDTLKVNLQQVDSIFLAQNYYLLAATMNIEAQKAQIIQAKLYPNPIFTGEINAYDPQNNQAFHVGQSGEKAFQLEQVILLGGKRKSEIEMAKTNAVIAEIEFQKLVRQLKYRLHNDIYSLGQEKILLDKYSNQLALLDTILTSYQIQATKGNIPIKDLVRLKGVYLKLNNERADLYNQYFQSLSNIQTLLHTTSIIDFIFTENEIVSYIKEENIIQLQEDALNNRPDLLIQEQNKLLAQQYFQYQKKLSIPDIKAFSSYDQRGGAFVNQINIGVSVPIPLWDRNQGNIKTSKYKLNETEYQLELMKMDLMNNLRNNYLLYNETVEEYNKATELYSTYFEITVKGMTENFLKRNVSILEFVDFFEAYNDVLVALSRIKNQLVNSGEQMNLLIGKDIY